MGRKTAQTQFYISKQDQGIYQQEADLESSQDQTSRVRSSLDSEAYIPTYQDDIAVTDNKDHDFEEIDFGSLSCSSSDRARIIAERAGWVPQNCLHKMR